MEIVERQGETKRQNIANYSIYKIIPNQMDVGPIICLSAAQDMCCTSNKLVTDSY